MAKHLQSTNTKRNRKKPDGPLTALDVRARSEPGYHPDKDGLYLSISKSGAKSWIFKYDFQGKRHEIGLGSVKAVSLSHARQKTLECRRQILEGINPLLAKIKAKQQSALERARTVTFDECAAAYIKAHKETWKNPKHVQQWENTLETYASPVIGQLSVAGVNTSMIVRILNPIWKSKTVTAIRVRARIERVLDWARVAGYRTGDNPARWKGYLDKMLAAPNKVAKTNHFAALPWPEIATFMTVLRQQQGISARAVEFAILTATRSGEVRCATWSEINTDEAVWTIPAQRMKAGKKHRVPLSAQALSLLKAMPQVNEYIFPGSKEGKPLSDMSLTAVLRRMGRKDITVHGFRSTFRDWCAEFSDFDRTVAEHALAHKLPDKTEAAYQRGDMLGKRAALMTAWADYCDEKQSNSNVISLPIAAAS